MNEIRKYCIAECFPVFLPRSRSSVEILQCLCCFLFFSSIICTFFKCNVFFVILLLLISVLEFLDVCKFFDILHVITSKLPDIIINNISSWTYEYTVSYLIPPCQSKIICIIIRKRKISKRKWFRYQQCSLGIQLLKMHHIVSMILLLLLYYRM